MNEIKGNGRFCATDFPSFLLFSSFLLGRKPRYYVDRPATGARGLPPLPAERRSEVGTASIRKKRIGP